MTSKERMNIALSGGKPDRVPTTFFFNCDYKSDLAGLSVYEFLYGNTSQRTAAMVATYERHPEDWLHCEPGISKTWRSSRRLELCGEDAFVVNDETGLRERIERDLTLHSQEWGSEFVPGGSFGYSLSALKCRAEEISTVHQLEQSITIRDASELIEDGYFDPQIELPKRYGREAFVCFFAGNVFFNAVYFFGSLEDGLIATHENEDLFRALVECNLQQEIETVKAGARLGGDGVWIPEMLASSDIISPRTYDEIVFPAEEALVDCIHEHGMKATLFLTGDVMPLLPRVLEMGVDALAVENRDKHGDTIKIGEIRKAVGDQLCLFGNVDPIYILARGSEQEIEQEVRNQIEAAGANGAFVMHSNIIPATVAPDKIDAMMAAAAKHGVYS